MVGVSPPHYRHDGTSPLPLGMDSSPAPSIWTGANTVWPHDPRTGWSYCVAIPSWISLPEAKSGDGSHNNRTVFFKVHVGIQSPQGVSTLRVILRRFSDFLTLYAALKRIFPKKELPSPPPKHSFLRVNSSEIHLHERKIALGDWISRLLTDIDISRCASMASFFELEAAARAGVKDQTCLELENVAVKKPIASNDDERVGITAKMASTRDEEATNVLSSSDSMVFEEQSKFTPRDKGETSGEIGGVVEINSTLPLPIENNQGSSNFEKMGVWHGRRLSQDSISSEVSSIRGSEISIAAAGDGVVEGSLSSYGGKESSAESLLSFDAEFLKGVQLALPVDQRGKVKRILVNLQRRLSAAKVDMESLIARLNQETTVKEFLAMKVKDLEGELDNFRRRSKDVLEQAVSSEREALTNIQWELEECQAALMNAEEKAQDEQEARVKAEEKLREVQMEEKNLQDASVEMKKKLLGLNKEKERIEAKAKADIRVLAKEIKFLRESQPGLRSDLERALQAKAELEDAIHKEIQWQEKQRNARVKFLHEMETLRQRLQECSVDVLTKEENETATKTGVSNAIDLLMTSDNRIGLLLAEAQLLAEERDEYEEIDLPQGSQISNGLHEKNLKTHPKHDQDKKGEEAWRNIILDLFIDNAQLRKALNSLTRNALVMASSQEKSGAEDAGARKSVLNRFI